MMRGGRGGRGRGGWGRGSIAHEGRREAIEEFHLDAAEIDQAPPPLYPAIHIEALQPFTAALNDDEQHLVDKMRDLQRRLVGSPYFLSSKVARPDIRRHSDNSRSSGVNADLSIYDCIRLSGDDVSKYIPSELLQDDNSKLTSSSRQGELLRVSDEERISKNGKLAVDLDGILKRVDNERKAAVEGKPNAENEEEDAEEIEEEAEYDDDYGVDHYASDNEGFDSGGEEAYFD